MQSPLRRCTGISQRRLSVWTRPIRNSVRAVWQSRSTRHGRFGPQGNAAPLWTTSGTVGTHWEWTQFWTCPPRNRLGQTGFRPLAIRLTIFLWFVTSALRRSDKEMKKWHTGRDNTENTESRQAPGRLRSTRRQLEETPCKRVKTTPLSTAHVLQNDWEWSVFAVCGLGLHSCWFAYYLGNTKFSFGIQFCFYLSWFWDFCLMELNLFVVLTALKSYM